MSKNNFILYKDFKPNIDILSDVQAGKLIKAVYSYVDGRIEPDFTDDGMLQMAFIMLKTTLERDLKKYKDIVKRNQENGKKGGRPTNKALETQMDNKKPSGLKKTQEKRVEPKKADSVSDRDIDRDNVLNNIVEQTPPYKEIISYLNQKLGTSYKSTSQKTQELINTLIKQGFTLDDFYKVIDNKYNDWFKTDMAQYLRPVTLFGNKFESYLNQVTKKKEKVYEL